MAKRADNLPTQQLPCPHGDVPACGVSPVASAWQVTAPPAPTNRARAVNLSESPQPGSDGGLHSTRRVSKFAPTTHASRSRPWSSVQGRPLVIGSRADQPVAEGPPARLTSGAGELPRVDQPTEESGGWV